MAKGARANGKKQLATWRREKLVAKWQTEADERRYAALAAAATSEPVTGTAPPRVDEPQAEARGRRRPKKTEESDAMEDSDAMEEEPQPKRSRGKNAVKAGGVGKKRRAGKLFLIGKNQFKSKTSKRRTRK